MQIDAQRDQTLDFLLVFEEEFESPPEVVVQNL